MRRHHRILLILIAVVFILACLPAVGATPPPIPTFNPNAPLTAIVQTAGAAATQTAIFAPPTDTATPLPTNTPTDTPTPTPTFLFFIPTNALPPTQIPLGSSQKEFDCQILSTTPKAPLPPNTGFIGKWIVANIGLSTWDSDNLDYHYSEGEKIHRQSIYDFPATIPPGLTVELTVDMQAPSSPGIYTTKWLIFSGKKSFCPMELTIEVK